MEKSDLVPYAIWFESDSLNDIKIENSLSALWEETWKCWRFPLDVMIKADADCDDYKQAIEPWVKAGNSLYFLLTESHWSPGDICGFLKLRKFLDEEDQVVAIKIDQNSYIPHQGLTNKELVRHIHTWRNQTNSLYLVRRNTPEE